jgi:hypothetical protein
MTAVNKGISRFGSPSEGFSCEIHVEETDVKFPDIRDTFAPFWSLPIHCHASFPAVCALSRTDSRIC